MESNKEFINQECVNSSIKNHSFSESTIQLINNLTNNILNGKSNLTKFNQKEHAGLCCAGEVLIGAYIVCCYARASLTTSSDASESKRIVSNWELDELQEKEEIGLIVEENGFKDNHDGKGINYISDRLHLEDMHPANVFIDSISSKPVCIDCIVKFRRDL